MADKSEWYVNENAFPSIISREIFGKVQEILPESKIPKLSGTHIMSRKLYCAECGKILKRNGNFYCNKSYQTGEKPCFQGSIKRDFLYKAVLEKVRKFIETDIPESRPNFSFSVIA